MDKSSEVETQIKRLIAEAKEAGATDLAVLLAKKKEIEEAESKVGKFNYFEIYKL